MTSDMWFHGYLFKGHAREKLVEIGATEADIITALESTPYPSKNHPGQKRFSGAGICLVLSEDGQTIVTAYLDKVITPLREDQIEKGIVIKRTR